MVNVSDDLKDEGKSEEFWAHYIEKGRVARGLLLEGRVMHAQ